MRSILLRTIFAFGIFLGMGMTATIMLPPQKARALPTYAQQTGKACGFCHHNPAGGGARNANGKKFEANGHKLK